MKHELYDHVLAILTNPEVADVWLYYETDAWDADIVALCRHHEPDGYAEGLTQSEVAHHIVMDGPLKCDKCASFKVAPHNGGGAETPTNNEENHAKSQ